MKLRKKQFGGVQCASLSNIQDPGCMPTPNVQMYVQPCTNLTENQFGMPGMPGLSLRGGRRRRVSKRRALRGGGSCAAATADCFGNVPAPAIFDGGINNAPNASELAWFFRNSYGATPSTNVIPQPNINTSCSQTGGRRRRRRISRKRQRGGNYFLNLNQRVGGLPPVENSPQEHAPSFSNLQVNSPNPADARVINIVPQSSFHGQAVPRLDTSSLTRNSMALSGGSRKKKSFLTRRSRNHLFGGSAAFPSAFNGLSGNFSADMQTRQFDCNQPNWCPKCT